MDSCSSFLAGGEFLADFLMVFDSLTGLEVFEFKELADFDFALFVRAVRRRDTPGPCDGFLAGMDVDNPVARDEFLGFGEGTINDRGFGAGSEADTGPPGARLQAGEIYEDASLD